MKNDYDSIFFYRIKSSEKQFRKSRSLGICTPCTVLRTKPTLCCLRICQEALQELVQIRLRMLSEEGRHQSMDFVSASQCHHCTFLLVYSHPHI